MITALCFAVFWVSLEMQWRADRRWAEERWRLAVWNAHYEVAADEATWA